MAKILVQNKNEHNIDISVKTDAGVETVTVPGARIDADKNLTPGVAEVEESMIDAAVKASPVVAHYFESGMLTRPKSAAKK